jgi:hypothetical protein
MDSAWGLLVFVTPLFLIMYYLAYVYGNFLYKQYSPSFKKSSMNIGDFSMTKSHYDGSTRYRDGKFPRRKYIGMN